MKILIGLTYYRPHYSGLTIYAERLARALALRGHEVTVLTSQFDKELPREEVVNGVRVVRVPVAFRLSKGVIMPTIPFRAWQEVRKADVVNLHVPQLDAAPISLTARLLGKPVVMTYQCDLMLPEGLINGLANVASNIANWVSASMANAIVTTSQDYADHSNFLTRYMKKVHPVFPPVILRSVEQGAIDALRKKYNLREEEKIVGMVARLAAEKGTEYLVRALPKVIEAYPEARVVYAGQHENVMGEEAYAEMLAPLIAELGDRWKFLGLISDEELAAFFHVCDALVLPSINSTEAFGMVQIEAMICGTPVVASDIPGVRIPVQQSGMGRIFSSRNVDSLSEALMDVLGNPAGFEGDIVEIKETYAPDSVARQYEEIFTELLNG